MHSHFYMFTLTRIRWLRQSDRAVTRLWGTLSPASHPSAVAALQQWPLWCNLSGATPPTPPSYPWDVSLINRRRLIVSGSFLFPAADSPTPPGATWIARDDYMKEMEFPSVRLTGRRCCVFSTAPLKVLCQLRHLFIDFSICLRLSWRSRVLHRLCFLLDQFFFVI